MRSASTGFFLMVIIAATGRVIITNVHRGGVHYEGPHWSTAENTLYWVDIVKQMVYRMDFQKGGTGITRRQIGYGPVSFAVTVKDNPKLLVVSARAELYLLPWGAPGGDAALRLLGAVDLGRPDNRCTDVKADAKGRLWFGTQGKEKDDYVDEDQGSLYMMDQYNHAYPETKLRPVSISNGITWTTDSKLMFYIDSATKNVDVYDFDLNTGIMRNRRVLFNLPSNNITGTPYGMTIDTDDNLWVACYNGGMVIKIDSRTGELLDQIKMPVSTVTSVAWGGRDLSTLYVTSSRRDLTPSQLSKEPDAGSLFSIEGLGTKGLPENQFVFPNSTCY